MTTEQLTLEVVSLKEKTATLDQKTNDLCKDVNAAQVELREQGKLLVVVERLTNGILNLNEKMGDFGEKMEHFSCRLTEIELVPGKKWDKVTWLVTTTVIAALLGAILGKFVI